MLLIRKGFVIVESRNARNFSSQKVMRASFKDSKWTFKDTEFVERGKRVILFKNHSTGRGEKYIIDERI
ncbi:MAG: hypothetical protein ACOCRO_03760 [Halanaerobiales bacterium]